MLLTGEVEALGGKRVSLLLIPLQILHGLTWD